MTTSARTYRFRTAEVQAAFIDYDKPHVIPQRFRDLLCTCAQGATTWPTNAHVHSNGGTVPVRDGEWLFELEPGAFYTCNKATFGALCEQVVPAPPEGTG